MQLIFEMLLLPAGLAVTVSALPLTHRFAGLLPDWTLSRGQVDQLADRVPGGIRRPPDDG